MAFAEIFSSPIKNEKPFRNEVNHNSVVSKFEPKEMDEVVVLCNNVSKHFRMGDTVYHVIQGLNLEIKRGTIFSLLGPSGCGKTTLLKCILGRLLVDQGSLKVFGEQPRPSHLVGYMPQDISLLDNLTVRETLWLFGRLGKLDKNKTRARIDFMLSILGMSSYINIPFKKLSGGQQRRVAFAAALLNEAPLLILDEPTVGVDPILRQNIWTYLRNIVRQFNTTVIITTHYIEEARNSQTVGLMLDGRLLAVSTPEMLIQSYGCTNLEDVFLKLSLDDVASHGYNGELICVKSKVSRTLKTKCFQLLHKLKLRFSDSYRESFNVVRIIELTKSNFWSYFRHHWAFWSNIFLPAFIFFMLPFTYEEPFTDMKLAVINHDTGQLGKTFIDQLDSTTFVKIPYGDYNDGVDALRKGSISGVLWIKNNFSSHLFSRLTSPILADETTIDGSTIYAALDYYNQPFATTIFLELNKAFAEFAKHSSESFGLNSKFANLPIELLKGYADEVSMSRFSLFFLPGFLLLVVFFVVAGNLCVVNVAMMESGYYERLYTTGVSSVEIIISQMMYQLTIAVPQLLLTFFVVIYLDEVDCNGPFWILFIIAFINYISGIFLGLLISGLSSTLHMAIIMFVVVCNFAVLLQGIVWPIEGMEKTLSSFCFRGPFTMPAIAMRNIMNKGWTFKHASVSNAFLISVVWSAINFSLTWAALWFRK